MEKDLENINWFFNGSRKDICLQSPFVHHRGLDQGIYAEGRVILEWKGELYPFRVQMPVNFPMSGMRFYYVDTPRSPHLLRNGLVCVSSPFSESFINKLESDVDAVLEWIERYLLNPSINHYEYLALPPSHFFLVFDETEGASLPDVGAAGEFQMIAVPGQRSMFDALAHTYIAMGLAGRASTWSSHYQNVNLQAAWLWLKEHVLSGIQSGRFGWQQFLAVNQLQNCGKWPESVQGFQLTDQEQYTLNLLSSEQKGIFVTLQREPLMASGDLPKTLIDLWELIPERAKAFLESCIGNPQLNWAIPPMIPLALGYQIPNRQELHWEWILIRKDVDTDSFWRQEILWGRTINAARARFFGRGCLHQNVQSSSVLLIGCGAIGSALAEVLARGGVSYLTLSDPQVVEQGNICRSAYTFSDIHSGKVDALAGRLIAVSPFITVNIIREGLIASPKHQRAFQEIKERVWDFDLVIDCTADDSVAWMLDQMKLKSTVINLSITDQANHLLAVANTGGESILPAKRQILAALGQAHKEPTFYEGQGCWHPTFRASYADINMLLLHWIADANHRLTLGKSWMTTVLETIRGDFGLRVVKREDV